MSTVNVVGVDANVDAWNSVNMHRFDVSGVEVPPPELRKVALIPPTVSSIPMQDKFTPSGTKTKIRELLDCLPPPHNQIYSRF